MNKRIEKEIELHLKKGDVEYRKNMLFFIEEVIDAVPIALTGKFGEVGHHGLCTLIREVVYDLAYGSSGEDYYKESASLINIVNCMDKRWALNKDLYPVKGDTFVWKPRSINPRIKFLKEVHKYISNKS